MIRIPDSPQLNNIARDWAAKCSEFFDKHKDRYRTLFERALPSGVSVRKKNMIWTRVAEVFSQPVNLIGEQKVVENLKEECERLAISSPDLFLAVKVVGKQLYEDFSAKNAYAFMTRLNVRTCPYCNRHYTFTVAKDKKGDFCTRAEFDHFHDKSTYPLLAVTFYNLVPSCHECNHGKGTRSVKINPYHADFSSRFVIRHPKSSMDMTVSEVLTLKKTDDFKLGFDNPTGDEKENIANLGLEQLYNEHKDYVLEIIEKYTAYDYATRRGLVDAFQGLYHSPEQIDSLIWGRYVHTAADSRRPLSKLTADLLSILRKG